MWGGVATYHDIEGWKYSLEQIKELHQILDLKEKIERESSKGKS